MAVEDEWRFFTITTAEKLFFYLFTIFGIYLSFMIMTQDAVFSFAEHNSLAGDVFVLNFNKSTL